MAVPDRYVCPITQEVMRRPMMDREGHNFEQSAILSWLHRSSHCPMGREPLSENQLFFNRALKEEIDEWMQHRRPTSAQPVFQTPDGMATVTPPGRRTTPSYASYAPSAPPPGRPSSSQPIYQAPSGLATVAPPAKQTPSAPAPSGGAVDPSCPWRHYKISQEEYDHIMCTFLTFDTDGSGAMDKDELKTMCKWLNYPHSDRDIEEMFRQMDTDGSGTLDLHEFVTYMQERRPRPEVQYGMDVRKYQQVLMQFHQFDTDGNGELDYQELVELCKHMKYPCSAEDVRHMFVTMDTDRSGRLSLHEFLTYMKTFDPRARRPTAPPMPPQHSAPLPAQPHRQQPRAPWPPQQPPVSSQRNECRTS